MGMFTNTPRKNPKYDEMDLVAAGEDSDAVKYVKEVMLQAVQTGVPAVSIVEEKGLAKCSLSNREVRFINVRNRIAIMCGIELYRNINDQSGIIAVFMDRKRVDIHVNMQPNKNVIHMTFELLKPHT